LVEIVVEGDAGELPFKVEFVLFAVGGVVQDGVDVMEDVLFCRGGSRTAPTSGVPRLKLRQRPIGDVVYAVAQLIVAIKRKASTIAIKMQVYNFIRS